MSQGMNEPLNFPVLGITSFYFISDLFSIYFSYTLLYAQELFVFLLGLLIILLCQFHVVNLQLS